MSDPIGFPRDQVAAVALKSVSVDDEMLRRATEAVVRVHEEELRAYLDGEVEANAWRPERYAEAAIRAALNER